MVEKNSAAKKLEDRQYLVSETPRGEESMGAVIKAVLDPAEIKQRVAASQTKLRAASQGERERNAHLAQVLAGVEKTLAENQQHISRLEEEQGRTLEEFRDLRDVLHDRQTGLWRRLRRCFAPKSYAARADLIARLDGLIFAMTEDGKAPDGGAPTERGTAPAGKRRSWVLRLLWFVPSLAVKALLAIFGALGSFIAEALVARKANSGMPLHLVERKRQRRLAGGADVQIV